MTPPARRIRVDFVISRVLAIVLPLGLLAYGLVHVLGIDARQAKRELENAGQLLNGEVLKIPVTKAIHKRMKRNPNLVLIGNSFANTNVDIADLGERLGMGKGRSVRLSIPNTIGTHWYALLKHRVFTDSYANPDVVLIVSDLQSALLTEPLSEGSYRNLLSLIDGDDAVIASRVEQNTSFLIETILENRAKLRRNAINTVREGSARRVLPRTPRKKVRKLTNEAMDRVFHPSRSDLTLRRHALPVAVDAESTQIDLSQLPHPRDSFLPDIARLCHEHGARLVMVRNKESPLMPAGQGDLVPPGTVEAVREAIGEWGGVIIDAEPIPMVAASYDNLDHMNKEGGRRFTAALAETLADLGTADDRERYVRPEKPAGVELPDAPMPKALAGIRRSWHALPDGSTATWRWDEAWPGATDTFRVRAVFESLDGGGPPEMRVAGRKSRMLALPSGRWISQHTGTPPAGPWDIEIQATNGSVALEGLEVGTGSTPLYLSGYRPDVQGHHLELLGRIEVFDGVLYRDAVPPVVPGTTPTLPPIARKLKKGPGPAAWFDSTSIRALSDMKTRSITPLGARCSPVRVTEDGTALPLANVGCKEVREMGEGRMCHTDRRIFFTALDGSHPMRNGRSYKAILDPERACDGGFWLYPGDVTKLVVPPERLRELRDGVHAIEIDLGLAEVREDPFGIAVRVLVNGEEHTTHILSVVDLVDRVRIRLDPRPGPEDRVELVFDNRVGETFAIANRAALVPPPIVWEGFSPAPRPAAGSRQP